jgi:uncharacterized integral membrane protein
MSDPTTRGSASQARQGPTWKRWGLGALIVLFVIVILQNSHETTINVLFFNITMPLIIVLALTALIGALIGYLAPMVRDRRRSSGRP